MVILTQLIIRDLFLPKSYAKSSSQVNNNRRKDIKTKKYEFNSINNKGGI